MAFPALIGAIAGYAFSLVLSILLILAGYRIFLHPLSKYPGPLLAKVSDWFAGIHAFRKDLHQEILESHEKYGPVVRLASNRLVFNTVEAYQDIYQNERVSKAYTYGSSVGKSIDNVFTARDKTVHRAKRKMIAPALNERAVKSFEPSLTRHIDVYLTQILDAAQKSEPVNMSEKASRLALDIVTELSFGYSLNVQSSEENRFVSKAIAFGLYRGNVWRHVFYLSRLWAYSFMDRLFAGNRERYSSLLAKMIRDRVARGPEGGRDFYSFITEGGDADNKPSGPSVWWEAHFLVVAGSDTTATTVSAAFFYLARNPSCYEKLASEIRSTFSSAEEIKGGPQLSGCRYLRACIDEALRMAPPIPGALWRSQDPSSHDHQPLIIDGHVIPNGTLFGVSAYALHHNEKYFPDSFTYKPERWLEARVSSGNKKKSAHDAFAAFSAGSRACAGKPMAYLESSLILAKTLWYFDFETAPGALANVGNTTTSKSKSKRAAPSGEFKIKDIFTAQHDGPYLVFRPRGELWKDLA